MKKLNEFSIFDLSKAQVAYEIYREHYPDDSIAWSFPMYAHLYFGIDQQLAKEYWALAASDK